MQPSDDGKWNLPERLRISDPEVLAQSEQMRAELSKRVQSPFAHLSSQEYERHNAGIMATHLELERQHLGEQINDVFSGKMPGDLHEFTAAHGAISARLAEAYATLGRYDLAAETTPDEAQRKEYVEVLEAINRPDDEWCECAPGRDHIKRDIILPNGERRVLRACSACRGMNVVPIPRHLSQLRGHRQQARQATNGMSMADAASHLRSKGHTTKLLTK